MNRLVKSRSACIAAAALGATLASTSVGARPLVAGNQEVYDQMQLMLGQDVVVAGRYHTSTGMVIASAILPQETTPVR